MLHHLKLTLGRGGEHERWPITNEGARGIHLRTGARFELFSTSHVLKIFITPNLPITVSQSSFPFAGRATMTSTNSTRWIWETIVLRLIFHQERSEIGRFQHFGFRIWNRIGRRCLSAITLVYWCWRRADLVFKRCISNRNLIRYFVLNTEVGKCTQLGLLRAQPSRARSRLSFRRQMCPGWETYGVDAMQPTTHH